MRCRARDYASRLRRGGAASDRSAAASAFCNSCRMALCRRRRCVAQHALPRGLCWRPHTVCRHAQLCATVAARPALCTRRSELPDAEERTLQSTACTVACASTRARARAEQLARIGWRRIVQRSRRALHVHGLCKTTAVATRCSCAMGTTQTFSCSSSMASCCQRTHTTRSTCELPRGHISSPTLTVIKKASCTQVRSS